MAVTPVGAPGAVAGSGVTELEASDSGPSPAPLWAWTVNVYGWPPVRPSTSQVSGPAVQTQVFESGLEVTVYEVIELPLAVGAVHDTVALPCPAVAITPVGLPGSPEGVTLLDGLEAAPDPSTFVAVTVNVYGVPFVRPVTVQESCPLDHAHVLPPGELVTVYDVIAIPPSLDGAVQETVAWLSAPLAVGPVGLPGTLCCVKANRPFGLPRPVGPS